MRLLVRRASIEDIEKIVSIHIEAFNGFFLTQLGGRFLKLYYSAFLQSPKGIILCALVDNCVVGFSACSTISRGFNRSLIVSRPFGFLWEGLKALIVSPKSVIRLVLNLNKRDKSMDDSGMYAELYSLAVIPAFHNQGIGGYLLNVTETQVSVYNQQISLTTDFYDNDDVIGFYHNMGYSDLYYFKSFPNRKMIRMSKDL